MATGSGAGTGRADVAGGRTHNQVEVAVDKRGSQVVAVVFLTDVGRASVVREKV